MIHAQYCAKVFFFLFFLNDRKEEPTVKIKSTLYLHPLHQFSCKTAGQRKSGTALLQTWAAPRASRSPGKARQTKKRPKTKVILVFIQSAEYYCPALQVQIRLPPTGDKKKHTQELIFQ